MAPGNLDSSDDSSATSPTGSLFSQLSDPAVAVAFSQNGPVIRAVNEAFAQTFDVEPASISGTLLKDCLVKNTTSDHVPTALETAFETGERSAFILRLSRIDERVFKCTAIRWSTHAEDTDTAAGPFDGWLVCTEVTNEYETIRELRSERDTLRAVIEQVSHDVRNPLEVAGIRLDAARETGEAVHFEKVEIALDRIKQLVSEELTLPLREWTPETREQAALGEIARSAWETVNTREATLSVDDGLPVVEADPAQVQTLFENLFRNAVDHGGPDVSVTVGPTADGFYVADDGPGLSADAGTELFEPEHSDGNRESGLGLSIVARVAEGHGWELNATRSDAGGARFEIGGVEPDEA